MNSNAFPIEDSENRAPILEHSLEDPEAKRRKASVELEPEPMDQRPALEPQLPYQHLINGPGPARHQIFPLAPRAQPLALPVALPQMMAPPQLNPILNRQVDLNWVAEFFAQVSAQLDQGILTPQAIWFRDMIDQAVRQHQRQQMINGPALPALQMFPLGPGVQPQAFPANQRAPGGLGAPPPASGAQRAQPPAPGAQGALPPAPEGLGAPPSAPGTQRSQPPAPGTLGALPPAPGALGALPPAPGTQRSQPLAPGALGAQPPASGALGAQPPASEALGALPLPPGGQGALPPAPEALVFRNPQLDEMINQQVRLLQVLTSLVPPANPQLHEPRPPPVPFKSAVLGQVEQMLYQIERQEGLMDGEGRELDARDPEMDQEEPGAQLQGAQPGVQLQGAQLQGVQPGAQPGVQPGVQLLGAQPGAQLQGSQLPLALPPAPQPPFTNVGLAAMALHNSPLGFLSMNDIREFIFHHFPRYGELKPCWRNHTLPKLIKNSKHFTSDGAVYRFAEGVTIWKCFDSECKTYMLRAAETDEKINKILEGTDPFLGMMQRGEIERPSMRIGRK